MTTEEPGAFSGTRTIFGGRVLSFGSCVAFALKSDRALTKCVVFGAELVKCAFANGSFLNFAMQSKRTMGLTITSPTSNCFRSRPQSRS